MCGIAGIIDVAGIDPAGLRRTSAILRHRGPDDEGFMLLPAQGTPAYFKGDDTIQGLPYPVLPHHADGPYLLGFMHRRLSILGLGPAGHQPMAYREGPLSIIFNGEVYNFKELRDKLAAKGYGFVTGTDTEVILAAYAAWGKACVEQFVGMWAFAIYDHQHRTVFFSRDRFGIKPLYYSTAAGKLAFASEIKALLAFDFVKPEANMEAVYEYLSFGATSDPSANLFSQVSVLPPGHNMLVSLHDCSVRTERYYYLEKQVHHYSLPKAADTESTFNSLLDEAISLHLRSDVPVGSTLSGGLDSSTLVAKAAARMQGNAFKTFTAAYHEKNIDESDYARRVTSGLSNVEAHYAYPDAASYWQDIDKLIWHQDLPINSTSMFAQWEVMKLAHQQQTKVLLDGQGADEMLGGYYNFAGIHLIELLKKARPAAFVAQRKQLRANFAPNINTVIGRAGYYFLPEFMQRSVRSRKRIGMGVVAQSHSQHLERMRVPERGGRTYRQQSFLSMQFGLQDLLRYEDRNSMAFSIESRVPFLDHRLVEFSIALDNDWKIRDGWTKYILRKTAEPLLPKEVVWRKDKMGFLTPQKAWKEASQKELTDFMHSASMPAFLNRDYILRLCSSELSESAHLSEFWKIVSFLKWASVFNVSFKD